MCAQGRRVDTSYMATRRRNGSAALQRVIGAVLAVATANVASGHQASAGASDRDTARPTDVAIQDPLTMSATDLAAAFPAEFEFLQREYGLNDRAAADGLRLTWGAGSTRAWAMVTMPDYAGTWVDYERATVVVAVAGGPSAMGAAQRQLAGAPSNRSVSTSLVARTFSYGQLVAEATRLQKVADPAGVGTVNVRIDEQNNALVVDGMSSAQSAAHRGVSDFVRTNGAPPVRFNAGTIADPAEVRGGWDGAQGAGCTMAFTVVSPSNERGVLTAGHCADNQVTTNGVTLSTAQFQRSFWSHLGGAADAGYDRQIHQVPAGHVTLANLQAPNVNITGSFLPAAGSVICRYGAASVAQGQAAAFCTTVTGYGYDGFVGMSTGCIYGDSGGPMWVMGKAVGVAAITTDPTWPVDSSSTCYAAPIKDQLNGTGYYLQDITFGYGTAFSAIGLFHPIGPVRILDSRPTGPRSGETTVSLAAALNYPDLGSAALSVTIVPRGTAGTATVYPGDSGLTPPTYDVSFSGTATDSNLVVSRVSRYTKSVNVSLSTAVDVIVDVVGYFSDTSGTVGAAGASHTVAMPAARVYDSRPIGMLAAGTSRDIQVRGVGGVPATAKAVIANVTVTAPTASGWLTAHAGGTLAPNTSNLNYLVGQSKARLAIVPLDASGRIRLTAGGAANTHVIVDVQGYLTSGTTANPGRTFAVDGADGRLLDTRSGARLGGYEPTCIDVYASRSASAGGLPRDGLSAVWLGLTITDALGSGYVVVTSGSAPSASSNLNYVAGVPRSNSVFMAVPSTTDGTLCVTLNGASAHVVVDAVALTVA